VDDARVHLSPAAIVHLGYGDRVAAHLFHERDMAIVGVVGRHDDGTDLWRFAGFISDRLGVIEPRTGIAPPWDAAALRDIVGAIAVGEIVSRAPLGIEFAHVAERDRAVADRRILPAFKECR